MNAALRLLGFAVCEVKIEQSTALLNVCRRQGIVYSPVRGGEEVFCFACRLSLLPLLMQACTAQGIALKVIRRGGLPMLLWRYRLRAGLSVGALLFAFLLTVGGRVVWDIRIEGNERVEIPVLLEQLEDCGLSVGCWLPSLDTDEVESRLLQESQQIAWVSVNIKGTVATVQIRELMKPQSALSPGATNLVAACDGVIESVRLLSGQPSVKVGDVVRAGELLASGVRDSSVYGYQISPARGEVLGRTVHTLSVTVPRESEQKRVTGQKNVEKTLFFFGKEIKVTKSTGIVDANCDTIKKLEIWSLPGGAVLPVSVQRVIARTYETETVTLSDEQLRQSAHEQLGRELAALTADAMLLSQRVSEEITPEGIVLRCEYTCVENIAKSVPLDVGQ